MGEGMEIDNEKEFFETYRKLDPINRAEVIARANLILHIQESTKKRMIERLTSPEYAERNPAPMGSLEREAVNA